MDAAAVCVAGVALGDIERHFAWQAWQVVTSTFTLHGRRGTYGTRLALVARLGWVWRRGRRRCLRGRRGTWQHRLQLCLAGVALGNIYLHFAWQAWHLAWQTWHLATTTSTLRGRRGWAPLLLALLSIRCQVKTGRNYLRCCLAIKWIFVYID